MNPIPPTRRCFTFGCTGIPEGTAWECPRCKRLIHLPGEQAARRAEPIKTSRCRLGACLDPGLPVVPWCSACRRIGIERRRAKLAEVTA